MKIAMLSEWWDPVLWGGQVYAQYLCEFLVKQHGCSIDLFTRKLTGTDGKRYEQTEEKKNLNRRVIRVGPTSNYFSIFYRVVALFNTVITVRKYAKKEKYDIIHAHALLAWIPAKIVWWLLGIPVVYTVHGTMHLDTNKKGLLYYAEKFLVTQIAYDCEISVSHKVLNYSNVNKNIVIIYPGIDQKRFERISSNEKYPWRNFLFVGRYDRQKWLEFLIEGINLIPKKLLKEKNFHLNLVGEWNLRSKLDQMISDYWLKDYIMLKERMDFESLVKEYKKNSVFILPSLAEGQPVVVFEAFVCWLPVVATDVGDNKYFIKDHKNGLLISPWKPQEIKKAIEIMLEKDDLELEKMGQMWYNTAMPDYKRENVVDKIFIEYCKLIQIKTWEGEKNK